MPGDVVAAKFIADLREKLLDLSTSNKLLSYKYSERGRNHVRVVDISPNALVKAIQSGHQLNFSPLPEPETVLPDENEERFLLALEAERLVDPAWQKLREEDEDPASDRSAKLDRAIRDRVRTMLGMEQTSGGRMVNVANWARLHDIEPDFDLLISQEDEEEQVDHLQTLLFPAELQSKASGVLDQARTWAEERGVNVLHFAVGFLEWYESPSSDKAMLAPLLLYPCELERKAQKGRGKYNYFLKGSEDTPATNLTLKKKLEKDFGMILPEFEEGDAPESYLEKVGSILGDKKRWRVRRFGTLGIFGFARLVMYNDLNPSNWGGDLDLADAGILGELFGAKDGAEFASSEEHDLDDPKIEGEVPLLIRDADSSQHRAIIDVMRGKNIVIKGPPGTGKSQTIANIIAAAMAADKTVLFLAEKAAALNVVKDRLDHSGLGHFCFELHSTKSKQDIVDSLEARLAFSAPKASVNVTAALEEMNRLRERLSEHSVVMNRPFGAIEILRRGRWEKATIHDCLWMEQRSRIDSPKIEYVDQVMFEDCESIDSATADRRRDILKKIEQFYDECTNTFGPPSDHPWRWINDTAISALDVEPFVAQVSAAAKALLNLREWLVVKAAPLRSADLPNTLTGLDIIARHLVAIPELSNLDDTMLRAALASTEAGDQLISVAGAIEKYREAQEKISRRLSGKTGNLDRAKLAEAVEIARRHDMDGTPLAEISSKIETIRIEAEAWSKVVGTAKQVLATLGVTGGIGPKEIRRTLEAIDLFADTGRAALTARIPSILEETARPTLEKAAERIRALRQREETLRDDFFLDTAVPTLEIRRYAGALKKTGFLAKMSGEYKGAKKVFDTISKTPSGGDRTMASMLLELADYIEQKTAIENDQALRSLCAHRFAGVDTDAEALLAANHWADKVRKQFAGVSEPERTIRRLILAADMETIDALLAIKDSPDIVPLRAAIEKLSETENEDLTGRAVALAARAEQLARVVAIIGSLGFGPDISPADAAEMPAALDSLEEAKKVIEDNELSSALGASWRGTGTDILALRAAVDASQRVHAANIPDFIRDALTNGDTTVTANAASLRTTGSEIARRCAEATKLVRAITERVTSPEHLDRGIEQTLSQAAMTDLAHCYRNAAEFRGELIRWTAWRKLLADARHEGLQPLLDAYAKADEPLVYLVASFDRVLHRSLVRRIDQKFPGVLGMHGLSMAEVRKQFSDLDKRIMDMQRQKLISELAEREIPAGIQSVRAKDCTDLALIRNEISRTRHIPTRALLDRAWDAIIEMKSCFMMSPLSVAQYLTPEMDFDLVVIDEASQMLPEDALGALARADQAVVVGDPQQLPPSGFFRGRHGDDEEDEEKLDSAAVGSILDLARAAFPMRELLWHYRSKLGSLIAFSNRHFYRDGLIVFPSPQEDHPDFGVKLVRVDGKYSKAKVNIAEAQTVAAAALDFMMRHPDKSLGIVALNHSQRDMIHQDMERLFIRDPRAEKYRAKWANTLEYFFVKNLENVQGDERDVIFISPAYAADENGNVDGRMFGPINGETGGRRLNVLFSRAKWCVTVFSSLTPDLIKVGPQGGDGAKLMKQYLEFAATGKLDAGHSLWSECDSDFEVFVKERVESLGFTVDAQVGVAGYRIDLGLKHPEFPYGYLVGIECDGAAYHSSLSARDRDRLRQSILESLGWRIYRIWSTDWFHDQNREIKKLLEYVGTELRSRLASRHFAPPPVIEPDPVQELIREPISSASEDQQVLEVLSPKSERYKEVDLQAAGFFPNPALVDDEVYEDTLVEMIRHIVTVEGPIREDVLARRIAVGHRFKRTGPAMKANVVRLARRFFKSTDEDVGRFFWPEGASPDEWSLFRQPATGDEPRSIEEICIQELRALIIKAKEVSSPRADPWNMMARLAGFQRLRAPSRERLALAGNGLIDDIGEEAEEIVEASSGCNLGEGAVLEQDEEIYCHLQRRDIKFRQPDGTAMARDGGLYIGGQRVEPQRRGAWLQAALRFVQQQAGDVSETTGDAKSLNAWIHWYVRRNGELITVSELRTEIQTRQRR